MALVAGVLALGTAGYSIIEGWNPFDSLYMTVITLTTVGYREVHPLSPEGQLFTIALILFGLGIVFYILNVGAKAVLEGRLQQFFGRTMVQRKLKALKGHYIVCGYGRMGKIISKEFKKHGVEFVVVEKEPLATGLAESGLLFLQGDATRDEVLQAAGIHRARGLVSVLPTDAENLYVVLTAKGLNSSLRVVARAGEEGSEQKLLRAGADRVISPYSIGGLRIAHSLLKPAVVDFIEFATRGGELRMEEIQVQEGSALQGKSLGESGLGRQLGIIVVAIKRRDGRMDFNPTSRSVLRAGDILIAMGGSSRLQGLEEMARGRGLEG